MRKRIRQIKAGLHEQVAKVIFQDRGTWSAKRADEFFAAYAGNPRSVAPHIKNEIRQATEIAHNVLSVVLATCADIADECHTDDDNSNGAAATGAAKEVAVKIRGLI